MTRRALPWIILAVAAAASAGCEIFLDFDLGESGLQCVDGIDNDGDGLFDCSDSSCQGASECAVPTGCGNGALDGSAEQCDDGNNQPGDGCSPVCSTEPGWVCEGEPSVCAKDGCATPNACPVGSICKDAPGTPAGFVCECGIGFTGTLGSCMDVDECASGANGCAADARCENTFGSYRCLCNAGTGGDGATCVPALFLQVPPQQINEIFSACDTDYSHSGRKAAVDGKANLYAAMRCSDELVVAHSADRGQTWFEQAVGITGAAEYAIHGGPLAFVYVAAITTAGDLVFTRSVDGGQTWAAKQVLGSGYDPAVGVSLATAGSHVYVAGVALGAVQVHDDPTLGAGSWFSSTASVAPTAFELLVDDGLLDAYVVGDDGSGMFVVPGVRSRTVPGLVFGSRQPIGGAHALSDWAWGNGKAYAVGSAGDETTASSYAQLAASQTPGALGEVPVPVMRQRAAASDPLGNLYMISAFPGATENDVELHFARGGDAAFAFSRPIGPGHSPSIVGLPTGDGALVVYSSGGNVLATIQPAPEPSCAGYLGPRDRGSGAYVVDPDGEGVFAPFGVACDMTTDGGGWTMVHKLSRDVAQSPLSAWFEMVFANDSTYGLLDTGLEAGHYTNSYVANQWNSSNDFVKEARVAVYTNQVENAFLRFTVPAFSDSSSWFSQANLAASSWTDLPTATPDFFALSGNLEAGHAWQITQNSDVCQIAAGWLVVDSTPSSCTWEDKFASEISILYADPSSAPVVSEFESGNRIKEADTMVVWIR